MTLKSAFFCYHSVLLCIHSYYSATNGFISNGRHHFFTQIYFLSPVCSQIPFVASYSFGSDLVNLAESKSYDKENFNFCFEVQVQLHSAV